MTLNSGQIELVRNVVAAKTRYWDALRELEVATLPPGETEWTDAKSDRVHDVIDDCAASCGESVLDTSMVSDEDIQATFHLVLP